MNRMTVILASALMATGLTLAGCGGGGSETTTNTTTTTMGQELQDLDKAYQDGLIDKDQYDKAKKDILERYDN